MNAVPAHIATLLAEVYANIANNLMVTRSSYEDYYHDARKRLIKREFKLSGEVLDGEIRINFKLIEYAPNKMIPRIDMDFIDDVFIDDGILYITSGEMRLVFFIEEEE